MITVVDVADRSIVTEVEMPDHEGREQVSITAEVTNNSSEGVDLACSIDLGIQIVSNGSAWGNVGYLERLPGNRQCGDLITSGEMKQMVWGSLMPEEAQPTDLLVQLASDPNFFEEVPLR